ncbi:TonB-dependent receptor [Catenovulum adriaticum]|uniref:TonB-dependent receptor n=1 Tax=Catenovulum adriaticum TaxID=2984846 RepID=A0ABY7AQF8_9ALTE|nr:TonB-dependent receptor [Catenovulum sp. TS8]WAJ71788.1 TonB-dependent receptor [Catenovulum sp. TS8]
MFKQTKLARNIQQYLWASLALTLPSISSTQAQESQTAEPAEETEIISVTGVRSSLRDAAFLKKNASQIMDAISAEDIGQLPDNNIAEALQRVTGVQIGRDDTGAGAGFQVRGLSQNRVEVNGQSMASSDGSRTGSFANVDSALFKAIEVYKSPTADMVEGAIGATIRLKTFQPLERKNGFVNINAQGTEDSLAQDKGGKLSIAAMDNWELESVGAVGALLNVSYEKRFAETHEMKTAWSPAISNQLLNNEFLDGTLTEQALADDGTYRDKTSTDVNIPFSVFRPEDIGFRRLAFEQDNLSIDSTIQWQPSEDLEFTLFGQVSQFERGNIGQEIKYGTRHQKNAILDHDLVATSRDESPVILGAWSRQPTSSEYFLTQSYLNEAAKDNSISPSENDYIQANQPLDRYIVESGTLTPTGSAFHAPIASQYSSDINTIDSETFSLATKYYLTDNLLIEAKYAYSHSEGKGDNIAQRFSPGTNAADTAGNALSNAYVHYDFSPDKELPLVGVSYLDSQTNEELKLENPLTDKSLYALHNGWGSISTNENEKDELTLDIDWMLDHDVLTKVEFGARYANNQMKRHRQRLEFINFGNYSIFSNNWRVYDRDTSTRPESDNINSNDKISIEFADQVMAEEYNQAGFYGNNLTTSPSMFPEANGGGVQPWLTLDMSHNAFKDMILTAFPGRQGDCLIVDEDTKCRNNELVAEDGYNEYDAILTIPQAQYDKDGSYPYLITESTKAVYGKVNFETEILDYFVSGNFGVRYVETETETLGVVTNYFLNGNEVRKDNDGQAVEQYDAITGDNSYSNLLPSLNINWAITEDMLLRFAAAKTMSRANPQDLSPSIDLPNYSWTAKKGNPNLLPEEATNYDLSWEWYINETNSLSAALFLKELDNFLTNRFYVISGKSDRDGDGDLTNDPITVKEPINGGDGRIEGIELAALHTFDYLPGLLNGFGVQANYTHTSSSQESGFSELDGSTLPVLNLSADSYNFTLFYDKNGFNFRAAYNYRTENLNGTSTAGVDPLAYDKYEDYLGVEGNTVYSARGIQLPEWNDEFATLDLSASYRYKKYNFFIQARNFLSEPSRRYAGDQDSTKHLLTRYQETGTSYVAGFSVRL